MMRPSLNRIQNPSLPGACKDAEDSRTCAVEEYESSVHFYINNDF